MAKNQNLNIQTVEPGDKIIPLEELDRKFSFNDVKTKFTLRGEGQRVFTDKAQKKVEYGALNGIVIKGPAKYNEMDKTYSMDIPILVFARFFDWLQTKEAALYFNELVEAEIKKSTGINRLVPRDN
jgi:hypothetical protein